MKTDELCTLWSAVVAAPRDRGAIEAAAARFDALIDHVERCDRCAAASAGLEQDRGALIDLYEALAAAGGRQGDRDADADAAAIDAALAQRSADEQEVAEAVEEVLVPGLSAGARALYRRVAAEASPAHVFLGLDALALLLHRLPAGALAFTAHGAVVRGDELLVPRNVVVDEIRRMAEIGSAAAASLIELAYAAMRDNPLLLLGVEASPVGVDRVRLERGERSAEEDLAARWLRGFALRAAAPRMEIVDLSDTPEAARAGSGDDVVRMPAGVLAGLPIDVSAELSVDLPDGLPPDARSAADSGDISGDLSGFRTREPYYYAAHQSAAAAQTLGQAASDRSGGASPWRWSRAVAAGAAVALAAGSVLLVLALRAPPGNPLAGKSTQTAADKTDPAGLGSAPIVAETDRSSGSPDEVRARAAGTDPGLACIADAVAHAVAEAGPGRRPILLNPPDGHAGVRDGTALAAYVFDARREGARDLVDRCTAAAAHTGAGGVRFPDAILCDRAVFDRIGRLVDDLASPPAAAPVADGIALAASVQLDRWVREPAVPVSLGARCSAWTGAADASTSAAPARLAALLASFELSHQRAHLVLETRHATPAPAASGACAAEAELRVAGGAEMAADVAAVASLRLADPSATPDKAAPWRALSGYLALDEARHWLPTYGAPSGRAAQMSAKQGNCDLLLAAIARWSGSSETAPGRDVGAGRCECPAERAASIRTSLMNATRNLQRAGFAVRDAAAAELGSDPALTSLDRAFVVSGLGAELVVGSFACADAPTCTGDDLDAVNHGGAIGVAGLLVQAVHGSAPPPARALYRLKAAILGDPKVAMKRPNASATPAKPVDAAADVELKDPELKDPFHDKVIRPK